MGSAALLAATARLVVGTEQSRSFVFAHGLQQQPVTSSTCGLPMERSGKRLGPHDKRQGQAAGDEPAWACELAAEPCHLPGCLTDPRMCFVSVDLGFSALTGVTDGHGHCRAAWLLTQVPGTACAPTAPHASSMRMYLRLGSESMLWTAQVAAAEACCSAAGAAAAAPAFPTSRGGANGTQRRRGAAPPAPCGGEGARCPLGPAQPDRPPWQRRQRHVLARGAARAAGAASAAAPPPSRSLGVPDTEGRG